MECRAPRVLAVSGKQHPVPHDDRLRRLYLEMSFVDHRSNICPMHSHQFVLINLALDQYLMSKALRIKSIENSRVVVILRTIRSVLSFLSAIILLLEGDEVGTHLSKPISPGHGLLLVEMSAETKLMVLLDGRWRRKESQSQESRSSNPVLVLIRI